MSETQPEKVYINPDLIKQLLVQLQKDFVHTQLFNDVIIDTIDGSQVHDLLYTEVKNLLHNNYGVLSNTLYRIDISEQQLKEALRANGTMDEAEVVTQLILKRELQKVVYKNIYKQNNTDDTFA
jgi:hypothetical protein